MLAKIIHTASLLGYWGYLLIFLAPFLESSVFLGLVFPVEIAVILAGFLSSYGHLDLIDCVVVSALGAVLGDSIGYAMGKAVGKDYFERHNRLFLLKRKHLQRYEASIGRHEGKTVFRARLMRPHRALVPFAAGMSGMAYGKFVPYSIAGGALWATAFTLLGYYFGQGWQLIESWAGRAGVFVLFMILVIAVFVHFYRKLSRNRNEIIRWFKGILSSHAVRRFEEKHPRVVTFIRHRLSPSSYLGLHLTIGLILSAVFIWIFGDITEDVLANDPLVAADNWVMDRVLYFRSPLANTVMVTATRFGGTIFVITASIVIIAVMASKRHFDKAAGFAAAILGGELLNILLKAIISRPRPISDTALIVARGWSFPSGHAMMSVVFYGMITYLLMRSIDSWRLRAFFIALAGFVMFVIGLSRIYLQVHYLSDVLAGFAGGLFWLTVCITGLEAYEAKKKIT